MRALYSRTNELFYAQAGLAAFENSGQSLGLRRAQEAYLSQYYETAGHIIALADGLGLVQAYVQTQRLRRHNAIFQAAHERPIWGRNSRQVGPWAIKQGLTKLDDNSDNNLVKNLAKMDSVDRWGTCILDGFEQYKAGVMLMEHAAEDMVGEDKLFCNKVVPRLGIVALKEPYDLLQASL